MSTRSGGGGFDVGPRTADRGLQLLAAALVLGGVFGILIVLSLLSQGGAVSALSAIVVLSLSLFSACVWSGWALWRGHPSGKPLATVLFALQVPSVSVAGLTYEFFTVASLRIVIGFSGTLRGSADMGAFLTLFFRSVGFGFVGVNVLAVGAVWYLLRAD